MRKYIPKYIETGVYDRVISVARSYYDDVKTVKLIKYDQIHATHAHSGAISNSVSNPVQTTIEQIERYTQRLNERIRAVETALARFGTDEQTVIRQNMLQGLPITYCNTQKSARTCKTIRHNFIVTLALELGEIY